MKKAAQTPLVSVIVPAYRAGDTIADALTSICSCGLDLSRVEVVIAPDDGTDYRAFAPAALSTTCTEPGPVASGVGPARNRAIAQARGTYLAFLDADDTWSEGYLERLMPLAIEGGIAFSPTTIMKGTQRILSLPAEDRLDFASVGKTGASFRPLVHRDRVGRFENVYSQDILHALELVSLAGGSAPVSDRDYRLQTNSSSVSNSPGFAENLPDAYRRIIDIIRAGETRIAENYLPEAAAVFEAKLDLNRAFLAQDRHPTYYEFLADHLNRRDTAG